MHDGGSQKIKPTASVVFPIYNAEEFLRQSIESVLSQTFKDFELLLLNDGSTDGSLEIIKYYALQDTRCKIYSWPNKGLIETLNEGVRLARADIILRMDADDICIDSRFERQIDYLNNNPECIVVGSKVQLIDGENLPISEYSIQLKHDEIDNQHINGKGGSICHPAAAIRKEALITVGGYHAEYQYAEDLDLFLRLGEIGKLANLPEMLLLYRQHIDSIGYSKKAEQLQSNRQAVSDAWKRRSLGEPSFLGNDKELNIANSEPTIASVHRKWAWWALSAGNLKTSRKHLLKAIRLNPLNVKNLRLLFCVLRGF